MIIELLPQLLCILAKINYLMMIKYVHQVSNKKR